MDFEKQLEKLGRGIEVEIQALGINLGGPLGIIQLLLFGILILGVIALVHFW